MANGITTVEWRHGGHFCAELESGRVTCDESGLVGKQFPSSAELLMVSLGSCIGSVLVVFSDRHQINLEGMKIDLHWHLADDPHRIGEIGVSVNIPHQLTAEQKQTLTHVAHSCLIHNTLTHPAKISVDLSSVPSGSKAKARKL
jgi:uncharacterized OsmC-like protein